MRPSPTPGPDEPLAVSAEDVIRAAERIRPLVPRSELRPFGPGLMLKLECEMPTGSFKIRGATNAVLGLNPTGVITGSSGNYGLALTRAARRAGVERIHVVVSDGFSESKRAALEAEGASITVAGVGNSRRDTTARELSESLDLEYIASHGEPLAFAGQGTIGLELSDDMPDLAAVIVPVGSGGLIAGIATYLKAFRPEVRIIGVEPENGNDTWLSLRSGQRISIDPPDTICDAVRTQTPGELTFPIIARLVDEIVLIPDTATVRAMAELDTVGIRVEPTGALPLAAARLLGLGAGTACVLSGGNISDVDHAMMVSGTA